MANSMHDKKSMPDFDSGEQELYSLLGERSATCPPVELLMACGQEVLPDEVEQTVQRHIDHCRLCTQLISDLSTLQQEELSPLQHERLAAKLALQRKAPSPRWGFYSGSIAATAILAVGILSMRARHASPTATATAANTATATYVAKTVSEPRLVPLAAPGAEAIPLLTRGPQWSAEPGTEVLLPAFTAYNHGDYALAAQRFTKLQGSYPHSALIPLYLGVSQLSLHRDAEAYQTLTQAVREAHRSTSDAAHWYAAIAAQRTGAPEAHALYASLCAEKTSAYSAESCHMAATLP